MEETAVLEDQVKEKILKVFSENNAIMIATTGGEYSPWILGAYFVNDGLDIYHVLEKSGKTMSNLEHNKNVAISISQNDATKDFLQGYGTIEILSDDEDARVRAMLTEKMPWFQTYTPVSPCVIRIKKFFVTSLEMGWFPAKTLEN
jgi:nitroimidazol reductase NimA-like FMN-containing flavoprotein (pyridoxamine 5'-phosphate oxidase superfamily)